MPRPSDADQRCPRSSCISRLHHWSLASERRNPTSLATPDSSGPWVRKSFRIAACPSLYSRALPRAPLSEIVLPGAGERISREDELADAYLRAIHYECAEYKSILDQPAFEIGG